MADQDEPRQNAQDDQSRSTGGPGGSAKGRQNPRSGPDRRPGDPGKKIPPSGDPASSRSGGERRTPPRDRRDRPDQRDSRGGNTGGRPSYGGQGRPSTGGQGRPASGGRPAGTGRPSTGGQGRPPTGGQGRPAFGGKGRGPADGGGSQNRGPARAGRTNREERTTEYEGGPRRQRQDRPPIPEDVTGTELDTSVRSELATLHPAVAKEVAQRLVLVGRLLDEDPETAYLHAAAARERAARAPGVREAVGLAAYRTGRYAEALAELRTVRRLTGSNDHLPVMADCERGLGRPERALEMLRSPEARGLDVAGRAELLIVAAGARADMGELEAAVITLQVPELTSTLREPWIARLRSAYADALFGAGRDEEARLWLERAAEADEDGETSAAERLAELDGVIFLDDDELDEGEQGHGEPDGATVVEMARDAAAGEAAAGETVTGEDRGGATAGTGEDGGETGADE